MIYFVYKNSLKIFAQISKIIIDYDIKFIDSNI